MSLPNRIPPAKVLAPEDVPLFICDVLRRIFFVFAHVDEDEKRKEYI